MNRGLQRELAEQIFEWILQRKDFRDWLDTALFLQGGKALVSSGQSLTAFEIGRTLLGMREWREPFLRNVGGPGTLRQTFLTRRIRQEVADNSFLAHACQGDVPCSKDCLRMLGEVVKQTCFFKNNRKDLQKMVAANKIVQEVLES